MQRLINKAKQRLRGQKSNANEEPQLGPLTDEVRQQINNLKSVCLFLGPYRNLTTSNGLRAVPAPTMPGAEPCRRAHLQQAGIGFPGRLF